MKITIESTTQFINLVDSKTGSSVPARVWEGETDSGIKVVCLISLIAAPAAQDLSQFDRELKECRPPAVADVFPLRMIL